MDRDDLACDPSVSYFVGLSARLNPVQTKFK